MTAQSITFSRCNIKRHITEQECLDATGEWEPYTYEFNTEIDLSTRESTLQSVNALLDSQVITKLKILEDHLSETFAILDPQYFDITDTLSADQTYSEDCIESIEYTDEYFDIIGLMVYDRIHLLYRIVIAYQENIFLNKALYETAKILKFNVNHEDFIKPLLVAQEDLNSIDYVLAKEHIETMRSGINTITPNLTPITRLASEKNDHPDFVLNSTEYGESNLSDIISMIELFQADQSYFPEEEVNIILNMSSIFSHGILVYFKLNVLFGKISQSYIKSEELYHKLLKGLENYETLRQLNSGNEFKDSLMEIVDTDTLETINTLLNPAESIETSRPIEIAEIIDESVIVNLAFKKDKNPIFDKYKSEIKNIHKLIESKYDVKLKNKLNEKI
jgi:hypothetical protein